MLRCRNRGKITFLIPNLSIFLDFLLYLKDARDLVPKTIQIYRTKLVSTFKYKMRYLSENVLLG